jgi:predicted membrane-bound spermidine synthase
MRLIDFFRPRVVETAQSKYSGQIRVVSAFGSRYLATGQLTQSGGLVKDVWDPVLRKYGQKNQSWLILGLAGGTIAKIISGRLSPSKIVGVEIDPLMIKLGKKYLDLNNIPNLEIVVANAHNYVLRATSGFDFILVDMYLGDELPEFVYDEKFLKKLGQLGQLVIFNHLFYDDPKRHQAAELVAKLKSIFPSVTLMRKLTNLLIICERKGYN